MDRFRAFVQALTGSLSEPAAAEWVSYVHGQRCGQKLDEILPLLLQIRNREGRLVELFPNAAQTLYARRRTGRNIILKARQVGMTTYIAARCFLQTLLQPGTVTLQVAHTQESAEQIFRIVRRFYSTLQQDLLKALETERSRVRELAFRATDSRYLVDTAGNPNVGRGLTIHRLHASEVAHWPGSAQETMAGLLASVPTDGQVDVESTANGVGGYFHGEWLRAQRGEPGAMTPHFFPWWFEPAYKLAVHPAEEFPGYSSEEQQLCDRHGLSREQMRFRRAVRRTLGRLAPQEFAETDSDCFLLSGTPTFELESIESRLRDLPSSVATYDNGSLLVWFEPQPERRYLIAADVAEGRASSRDGDYSAAVVLDLGTGLQCAELLVRWPVARFAGELDRLGRYYNDAMLAVERNNHGHAVLLELEAHRLYPHLYRHGDGALGWLMNAQTRPQALQSLAAMLRDAPRAFCSKRLLEQCRAFSDSGDSTEHDDLVIAAAIAHAVRARTRPVQLLAARV